MGMAESLARAVDDAVDGLEEIMQACFGSCITSMLTAVATIKLVPRVYCQALIKGSRSGLLLWLTEVDVARLWVEKRHTALTVKVGGILRT